MAVRERVGDGVLADVVEPHGTAIVDQQAEHGAAERKIADRLLLFVCAVGEHELDVLVALVENRERGVASTGQLKSRLEHAIQDRFAITDVDKPAAGVHKSA